MRRRPKQTPITTPEKKSWHPNVAVLSKGGGSETTPSDQPQETQPNNMRFAEATAAIKKDHPAGPEDWPPRELVRANDKTPASKPVQGPGDLEDVEIELIDIDVSSRALNEQRVLDLMESIKSHGLQSPIIVFHKIGNVRNNGKDRFSLGPGAHRLEAHKRLGRKTIPAFVRPFESQQQVRLAQAIENIQRKDLTPLEEAMSCQVIVDAEGGPHAIEKCAAMLGQTKRWLENRLALNRLSPRVQQLLLDGHIYLAHAQVLARLVNHEKQEEIAGRFKGGPSHWDKKRIKHPNELHDWKKAVEDEQRTLVGVPWKLDAEFAGKPACNTCPHNSANAPGLFDGDVPKKTQCLLASCYGEKNRAASNAVRKAANTVTKLKISAPAAAKEREVEFVEPKAIAAAAKRQAAPSNKPTRSERHGQQRQERDWETENKWREAMRHWHKDLQQRVMKVIGANPIRRAALCLVATSEAWTQIDNIEVEKLDVQDKKALAKIAPILKMIGVDGDSSVLIAAAKFVDANHDTYNYPVCDFPNSALAMLATEMKIDFATAPKLEDFAPKPKPAKAPAGTSQGGGAQSDEEDMVPLSQIMKKKRSSRGASKKSKKRRGAKLIRGGRAVRS